MRLTQEVFEPIFQNESPNFIHLDTTHRWQNNSTFHHNLNDVLASMVLNATDYPTMYHVRHKLISTTEKHDIRLIFLAVYNLIKYRGHFNYKGTWAKTTAMSYLIIELNY